MSRRASRAITRSAPFLVATALIGALAWPLLFTYSGFAGDWSHHLWLVWHQSLSIQSTGLPSFFLNSSYSLFNPVFAFYGGTLYAISGALALVFGPLQAYLLMYVLDFIAAFGGWYWLSRAAGLDRWSALVPGLIFITSAYYVAIIYVQGDWPEFTAVSMIPLMIAAGLSVLRAERLRPPAAFALTGSAILFFGSHNLTILLGSSALAAVTLAIVVFVPNIRSHIKLGAVARVAGIVVPAAMVSAWYLLPAVVYASRTRMGHEYLHAKEAVEANAPLVSLSHLLTFSRSVGPGIPPPYYLVLALPVVAIAWVLVGVVTLPWRNHNRTWVRLLLIFCAVAVLIAIVMTHVGLLLALPPPYAMVQFSYRLEIYVLLILCAAVLAALVLAKSASRRVRAWRWLAVPVCAVSLAGAVEQMSGYPYPGQDRYATLQSYGEIKIGESRNNEDYQDNSERIVNGRALPKLTFVEPAAQAGKVSARTSLSPGTWVATNIAAGSYLVRVTGATVVGLDSESDDMVLAIGSQRVARAAEASTSGSGSGVTVTVSTGDSLPIVLGRLLTLCGLAILALTLLVPIWRELRRRPH